MSNIEKFIDIATDGGGVVTIWNPEYPDDVQEPMPKRPDFTIKTFAVWKEIEIDVFDELKKYGKNHHTSESGSEYFEINIHNEDWVYRKSNHWHANIRGCGWFLDGKIISRLCAGKIRLCEFTQYNLDCLNDDRLSANSKKAINHYLQNAY